MEQKRQHRAITIDRDTLKRQAAELEQSVFVLCSGVFEAVHAVGEIKRAVGAGDWEEARRRCDWLKAWQMRSHDLANVLTIVAAYVEFEMANGENESDV